MKLPSTSASSPLTWAWNSRHEIGVLRLGQRGRERVAEQVRDRRTRGIRAARRPSRGWSRASSLDVQELVGRHVLRQHDEVAVGHEHGGKHQAVEDDVVLADEVDERLSSVCQYVFQRSGSPCSAAHSFVAEMYPIGASNQT
jgi:hypothetical protein